MKRLLLAAIYGTFCYSLATWPAIGADLPVKSRVATPADFNTNVPCVTTGCTGWYAGGHVEAAGSNADIVGSGLNGSIFDNGVGLGGQFGYQLWNGNFFAAAEVGGTYYTGNTSLVTTLTNVNPMFSVDYIARFGYGLNGLFATAPTQASAPPSVIQTLSNMLTSPFFLVGGRYRPTVGNGLEVGAGLQYALGGGFMTNVEYFHVTYNTTEAPLGVPVQIGTEQGVRIGINKLFSF